jgi:hypothetical protein
MKISNICGGGGSGSGGGDNDSDGEMTTMTMVSEQIPLLHAATPLI